MMEMDKALEALKERATARLQENGRRFGFTVEEWTVIQRYHRAMAEYCEGLPGGESCEKCGLRLYCYTAPQSVTPEMVDNVVNILEKG